MSNSFLPNEITGIEFKTRPEPVPYNYRISYKVAQLCLILFMIKKGGCSFLKLQMISVALSSEYDMIQMQSFINGELPDYSIISFDPSVNSALLYARAEGLIEFQSSNDKFKLTEKGVNFATEIYNANEIMAKEKINLKQIVGKISDKSITDLFRKWGDM